MAGEYWDRYWTARKSRRRFLGGVTVAGAGAAGLALVGCGDDDNSGNDLKNLATATPNPSVAASPTTADPFANAKKGGTFNAFDTGNPPSIDPYGNGSFHTKAISAYIYSRLYKYNAGPGVKVKDLKPVPDLAEKAESPDGITWTVSIRKDAKFHDTAPVSGRAVTSDDLKFSWSRVMDPKTGVASRVPFVDSVAFPDDHTMTFKLKNPYPAFLDAMADTNIFFIMPKEAEGGFDPATKMIGSGPWVFEEICTRVGDGGQAASLWVMMPSTNVVPWSTSGMK